MKKLVIIEGKGKKDTIQKYLGPDYTVFATMGHVRDLPEHTLAVNVANNFEPKYVVMDDKKEIVEELTRKAKAAQNIYLATDPDREGEAISWHLAHILKLGDGAPVRIEFNEISKKAIQNALERPRAIDVNLVDAQQARRVLDRLVGYKISPVLCRKIQGKLSAGRVQSVTLRLVVDREREILNFKPEEHWDLTATLEKLSGSIPFKSVLAYCRGEKIRVPDKAAMDAVLARIAGGQWVVEKLKKGLAKAHAPAPFITSTLQQDALNKLGFSLKQTSSAAQRLYEGVDVPGEGKVALITYIRTDSVRVSPDAQRDALEFIRNKFGARYAPEKPNFYATKKSAQDAHEAIRPITLDRDPEALKDVLDKYLYRLYKLIYDRFLASQMSEAEYNTVSADIARGDFVFRSAGRTVAFDGYTAVYNNVPAESESGDNVKIPEIAEGEILRLLDLKPEQKFTKPPPRFTEASLVKAMEEKGVGRPATYTPTVMTLLSRQYVEKDGKSLKPTELGFTVTDMLIRYFTDIMDVQFTADMETKLDEIEEGGKVWQNVVSDYYSGLEEKIAEAMGDEFTLKQPDEATDIVCDKCGANMVLKNGRYGKFLACPNFPKCRNIKNPDGTGKDMSASPLEVSDVACEKCGAKMVVRDGKYGKFLACPNYPECKNIKNLDGTGKEKPPAVVSDVICEKCGAKMVFKEGRYGKFLACPNFPKCRNMKKLQSDGTLAEDAGDKVKA